MSASSALSACAWVSLPPATASSSLRLRVADDLRLDGFDVVAGDVCDGLAGLELGAEVFGGHVEGIGGGLDDAGPDLLRDGFAARAVRTAQPGAVAALDAGLGRVGLGLA